MSVQVLEQAWQNRERELARLDAIRIFHGPGEGRGPWSELAIERFGSHAWVISWGAALDEQMREECHEFLLKKGMSGAALVARPEKGVASLAEPLFGELPDLLWVKENSARFAIRFRETRHPGLFLDHEPLRRWLSTNAKGWSVLNTFAYTGSLSVACALGGAKEVTTLDLSKSTIEWARENWAGNSLPAEASDFISGDFFEWAPKLARRGDRYDCVILDPPSFSRGKKGTFSTSKDLRKLHAAAFDLFEGEGTLVTSINSATVPKAVFDNEVSAAAREAGFTLERLLEIELPPTFPARTPEERYLKGGVYRCVRRSGARGGGARPSTPSSRPR